MTTFLVILGLLLAGAAVYFFFLHSGKIEDKDGDFIPDAVEEKVEEVKADVKRTVKKVKEKVDVVEENLGDVIDEVKEIATVIKGKVTKSKLNSMTKQKLVDAAQSDHGVELDPSAKKSTIVNKVYSLYNKK